MEEQDGIKKILERSTVESISSYIKTGGELQTIKNKSITKRKTKVYDQLNTMMEACIDEKFHDEINGYIAELVDITFHTGIKAGAKLTTKLLSEK